LILLWGSILVGGGAYIKLNGTVVIIKRTLKSCLTEYKVINRYFKKLNSGIYSRIQDYRASDLPARYLSFSKWHKSEQD
jgi:hypothetical protein